MFPWVYEFQWQPGHLIFLGLFFAVAVGIGVTVAAALRRTRRALAEGREEAVRWQGEFHELPEEARLCRSALSGAAPGRQCANGFDCAACPNAPAIACLPGGEVALSGLRYPLDRAYDRGHTWVRNEPDGTVTVGLDDLAARLLGSPDRAHLPAPGTRLALHGTAWHQGRRGSTFRILSPVAGTVVACRDGDWVLRVHPEGGMRHLLRGEDEIRGWVMREVDRLQMRCRSGAPALADGGELVKDLSAALPPAAWDGLCGEVLLDL